MDAFEELARTEAESIYEADTITPSREARIARDAFVLGALWSHEDEPPATPPTAPPDLWHTPHPGPWPTWDWRCRICSEPVDDHPSLIRRFAHAWRNR